MRTILVSMLIAFLISVFATPMVLRVALRRKLVDATNEHRKIHEGLIPRLGGIAIVAGFYTPLLALLVYDTGTGSIWLSNSGKAAGLLLGGLVIAVVGIYDDVIGCGPRGKLFGQFLASAIVIFFGSYIDTIDLPLIPGTSLDAWVGIPITVLWIVGLTNAVNLIDGLDGLAGGIALIGLIPFSAVALSNGDVVMGLMTLTLAGAVSGFLVFNVHPARIFMGDTGSMFLGFVLAVTALQSSSKTTGLAAILLPLLPMALPILDTSLAFVRRIWFGQNPFAGDREHIHHRLLSSGMSHGGTVAVMWGVSAAFAVLGLLTTLNRDLYTGLALGLSTLVAGLLMRRVGFLRFGGITAQLETGAQIRKYHREVRDQVPMLHDRMGRIRNLDEAKAELERYMQVVRARGARLRLHREDVWEWGESTGVPPLSFPLAVDGREIGTLTVTLDVDSFPVTVAEQKLRDASNVLAFRLDTCHPATVDCSEPPELAG